MGPVGLSGRQLGRCVVDPVTLLLGAGLKLAKNLLDDRQQQKDAATPVCARCGQQASGAGEFCIACGSNERIRKDYYERGARSVEDAAQLEEDDQRLAQQAHQDAEQERFRQARERQEIERERARAERLAALLAGPYCTSCDTVFGEGARFCATCGAPIGVLTRSEAMQLVPGEPAGHAADPLDERDPAGHAAASLDGGDGVLILSGAEYRPIAADRVAGEAFCLGCRRVVPKTALVHCGWNDTYYHASCLLAAGGTPRS